MGEEMCEFSFRWCTLQHQNAPRLDNVYWYKKKQRVRVECLCTLRAEVYCTPFGVNDEFLGVAECLITVTQLTNKNNNTAPAHYTRFGTMNFIASSNSEQRH